MTLQTGIRLKSTLILAVLAMYPTIGHTDEGVRTRDLTQSGWEIIEKSANTLRKPGIAPYQNATRVIEVTTYKLAKGPGRYTCKIAYDRQRDQFEESCMQTAK
jgi:hypothetical protein